jgi:hypothetical protein
MLGHAFDMILMLLASFDISGRLQSSAQAIRFLSYPWPARRQVPDPLDGQLEFYAFAVLVSSRFTTISSSTSLTNLGPIAPMLLGKAALRPRTTGNAIRKKSLYPHKFEENHYFHLVRISSLWNVARLKNARPISATKRMADITRRWDASMVSA